MSDDQEHSPTEYDDESTEDEDEEMEESPRDVILPTDIPTIGEAYKDDFPRPDPKDQSTYKPNVLLLDRVSLLCVFLPARS